MQQANVQVFDEHLSDTAPSGGVYHVTTYTSLEFTGLLSSAERLGLQATVEILSGRNVPVSVAIEHTSDGRSWKQKSPSAEVSGVIQEHGGTLVGGEPWPPRPSQRFVRLRIEAGDGRHPFEIRVGVHVTARARPARARAALPMEIARGSRFAATEAALGVRGDTVREVHDLVMASRHLMGEERYHHVFRNLSRGARTEIWRLVARLRSLDPASRVLLTSAAVGLLRVLASPPLEAQQAGSPPSEAADG